MLLDSSAWIEFFEGVGKYKRVAEVLKSEENHTCIVTVAEVVNWCLRNNLESKIMEYIEGIAKGSKILNLTVEITAAAGRLNFERKKFEKNWGMLDSLILSTALFYNLRVLTKDPQFKDLPDVEML